MLPFTKMQAVGNDFIVVEQAAWPGTTDWPRAALRLCDRKFGVGADGLLVVGPSEVAEVRMRMFNPDGSEDMCGNGLRCVIRYALDHGIVRSVAGTAEALDGIHAFQFSPGVNKVQMHAPLFAPQSIPMLVDSDQVADFPLSVNGEQIPIWAVSTGTTHAVVFVDELPSDDRFFALSPLIEHHPLFPERTSVLWTTVEHRFSDAAPFEPARLRLRIWERGAGETLGCGTGACAAAVCAITRWPDFADLHAPYVKVESRGGTLVVHYDNGQLSLLGPAETVYRGGIHAG